jgi:hypothetical protein
MTLRALALAAVASMTLAAPAAAAAPQATAAVTKTCKNTYGGDFIRATNIGCRISRKIVRTWGRRYKRDGDPDRRVIGFECRGRNDEVEGLIVTCRREGARIRFFANVP